MKVFTALLLLLVCLNMSSYSQQPVAERPAFPQEARHIQSCERGEIWIKGEWKWDTSTESYIWEDGRCENCPRNKTYVPGGWKRENDSWVWAPGTWKKISRAGFREP